MKKIALVLGVVLVSNMNNGFYGSQLIQREYDQDPSQISFLDAADNIKDEYVLQVTDEYQINLTSQTNQGSNQVITNDQIAIDEYDQHVCDTVQPAKISTAEALIKEMLGFVLVQYLTIKEMTQTYCTEIKQTLDTWFTKLMKA